MRKSVWMCLSSGALLCFAIYGGAHNNNHCRNRNRLPSHSSGRALSVAWTDRSMRWNDDWYWVSGRRLLVVVEYKGDTKTGVWSVFHFNTLSVNIAFLSTLSLSIWSDDCGQALLVLHKNAIAFRCSRGGAGQQQQQLNHNVHNTGINDSRLHNRRGGGEERNALDCEVRE